MSEELTQTCENCGECMSLCDCDVCQDCGGKDFGCSCHECGECAVTQNFKLNDDGLCGNCCDPRTGESLYDKMVADARTHP